MDAVEMMEKLTCNPIVRANIGLQMQLGLPYLEKRKGKLCVTCLPHREEYRDGMMEFFTPQYQIAWVYPFDRIIACENTVYFRDLDLSKPVCAMPAEKYLTRGKYVLNELYAQCSGLLAAYEQNHDVSDVALRRYQKAYYETVQEMGLTGVYGENNG